MATEKAPEKAPETSSTSKSDADAEVFQLEALSLNYLRSQNISALPDDDYIPKLRPCKLCNKAILSFRFEAFTALTCGHLFHRICLEIHIIRGATKYPACPTCKTDIEIFREETALASGECDVIPRRYDKGKASQQSNVTIDDDMEFMQGLGLIAEKDSSSVEITKQVNVEDRGTSPIANNPVTTQEQATSPIANNSLSTQEQATKPITNEKGNLVQVNSTDQSDINDTVIQDQSTDEGGDTTNARNRTSRQASPKIAREQDKLLGLIRELSSPVEGETAEIKKGESENSLARLYQKALKAENRVTQAYQEEIRCWYYYAEEFEKKVMSIRDNDRRIGDQQARTKVYDEIRDHLSGITKDTLRKKTQRARAIYNLFKKIGVEKIKRVHSYSADAIASLTVSQMQTIIDRVTNSLSIA